MDKLSKNSQKGFTLVEMLGVIAIILIILSIATPIVMNVVKDSKTEEFVSNAKILEDSIDMYYRDNGVMPVIETSEVTTLDEKSRKIILSKLVESGVTQPESVLDKLIEDKKFKKIDYSSAKDYTKVSEGDEGAKVFIVVDLVKEGELDEKYGVYENDLAGFVFSEEVRDKTSGIVYSGAHSMTDEESGKLEDDIDDLNKVDDKIFSKGMNPYGFKLVNVKDNKNATVDLTVSWTNRIVDNKNNLDTFKGYVGTDFVLECSTCDNGASKVYDLDKSKNYDGLVTQKGNTFVMVINNVPADKVLMSIKYDRIFYAGKDIGKETKVGYLNGNPTGDEDGDGGEVDPTDPDIDLGDIVIDGGGNGTVNPPVCGDCGADEILDGMKEENKNDLFKNLEEVSTFNANNIVIVSEGIKINNLSKGDTVVLKEFKKVGNIYQSDENRTKVFELTDTKMLIPKNPYLQKDFQTNASSNYIYVLEAYKNKLVDNSSATSPKNPVEIYYEN